MKVEYINPFIEASQSIFKSLFNIRAGLGKPYLKTSNTSVNQIIIIIGVVGKISGQVYFELTDETAKTIASTMMGGFKVSELDELSKSAISEMGNMIMGRTSILFAEKSLNIDITPPTVITGDKLEISNKIPTIVIPLDLDGLGKININISIDGE